MKSNKNIHILISKKNYNFFQHIGELKNYVYLNFLTDSFSINEIISLNMANNPNIELLNFYYIIYLSDTEGIENLYDFENLTKEIFHYSKNYEFYYNAFLIIILSDSFKNKISIKKIEDLLCNEPFKIFSAIFIFTEDSNSTGLKSDFYEKFFIFLKNFIVNSSTHAKLNYFFSKFSFSQRLLPIYVIGIYNFKVFDKSIRDLLLITCFKKLYERLFKNNVILDENIDNEIGKICKYITENFENLINKINKTDNFESLKSSFFDDSFLKIKEFYLKILYKHNFNLNYIEKINNRIKESLINKFVKIEQTYLSQKKKFTQILVITLSIFIIFLMLSLVSPFFIEIFLIISGLIFFTGGMIFLINKLKQQRTLKDEILYQFIREIIKNIKDYFDELSSEIAIIKSSLTYDKELPKEILLFFEKNNIEISSIIESFITNFFDKVKKNNEYKYLFLKIFNEFNYIFSEEIEKKLLNLQIDLEELGFEIPDFEKNIKLLATLENKEKYLPKYLFENSLFKNIQFFTPHNYYKYFKKGLLKDFYDEMTIIKIIGPVDLNDFKFVQ